MSRKAIEITNANFEGFFEGNQPLLVNFWAEWSLDSKRMTSVADELAEDFAGKAIIGNLDTENNQQVTNGIGLRSIPAVYIFKGGKVVERIAGLNEKFYLAQMLEKHID